MSSSNDSVTTNPPPIGNAKHADKYIDKLVNLLKWDKAKITHSDLNKFDPSSMQDHYRIALGEYDAEISHSINPISNQNIYLLIFTNVSQIKAGLASKAILSYLYLTESTFRHFKSAADGYFERLRQAAEDTRFQETMQPVDEILENALEEVQKDEEPDDYHAANYSDLSSSQIIH